MDDLAEIVGVQAPDYVDHLTGKAVVPQYLSYCFPVLSRTFFVKYMKLTYSELFNSMDCLIIILIAAIWFDLVWSDLPAQKPACSSLRSVLTPALILASTCGRRQGFTVTDAMVVGVHNLAVNCHLCFLVQVL